MKSRSHHDRYHVRRSHGRSDPGKREWFRSDRYLCIRVRFKYCRAELLDENYFHAVLEAIKGIAQRIRDMSLLTTDGAELVNSAFSVKNPVLKINSLTTETEISEQKGFSNMLVGLFGAVRNPVAHAPKKYWVMSEQDALDILSTASFIHRKLDIAVKA